MRFKQFQIDLFLCLCVALPMWSHASSLAETDTESDVMAVRELMRLDTEQALRTAKGTRQNGDGGSLATLATAGGQSGHLKLVAIYGVGKKLMAEVLIGGKPQVYMRGLALPIGANPGNAAYLLAGLSGSCVHLTRQDEEHSLCLHPSLRVSR